MAPTALPPPNLHIPSSPTTVHIQIIDTTSFIDGIPTARFISPSIAGFSTLSVPAFSFLITHPLHPSRSLLFDLGVRKDWENLSEVIVSRIKNGNWKVSAQKGVRELLEENAVDVKNIEGIIWSHWHWDHTGDPSTFDKSTALIVGPGFKDAFVPGYPANKNAPILESDYADRELREISFEKEADGGLKIGNFRAFDYYGDGSFYLLDSPGHAIGHLCGLARVTASPPSFVFMGDVTPCPGSIFEHLLRDGDSTKPFYTISRPHDGSGIAHDADEAERTIEKVIEADAQPEILVVMAHDSSLVDVVDFFPAYADEFVSKGWIEKGRWGFLKDFKQAVEEKS